MGGDYASYADLNDIFESMFGGEGFTQRRTRTDDMVQRLPLTLDELYTGVKKDFAVNRNKICKDCKGYVLNSIFFDCYFVEWVQPSQMPFSVALVVMARVSLSRPL